MQDLVAKLKQGRGTHGYLLIGSPARARELVDRITRELGTHAADKVVVASITVSIDEIKFLIRRLIVRPFASSHKLAYVQGRLTAEAAAALLKIVEEPPGKTLLFFQVGHVDDIPVTLASRLEKVRLGSDTGTGSGTLPSFDTIKQFSLREQFALAAKLAQTGEVAALVDALLVEFRRQLVYDIATQTKIEQCLQAKQQLNYNVNERLLLENLLVTLSH